MGNEDGVLRANTSRTHRLGSCCDRVRRGEEDCECRKRPDNTNLGFRFWGMQRLTSWTRACGRVHCLCTPISSYAALQELTGIEIKGIKRPIKPSLFMAPGSRDKTIKIWDPTTMQCLFTMTGHDNWVSVAFPPIWQIFILILRRQVATGVGLKTGRCTKILSDAHTHCHIHRSAKDQQSSCYSFRGPKHQGLAVLLGLCNKSNVPCCFLFPASF
ncbi:hypothetical protein BJ742DRAFT_805079 [Cladochytrium replicatum]|nr:hypothetical protein BJ742DRAFT_805079 [Cladochytrium replicatum]